MSMMAALLIFLNTLYVYASTCSELTGAQCAADPTCSFMPARCGNFELNECDTSSLTCDTEANCAPVGNALFVDPVTCSRCVDVCHTLEQPACGANPGCEWSPDSCVDYIECYSDKTKASCLAHDGCFWYTWNIIQCGTSYPLSACAPCDEGNGVADLLFRSAQQNSIGKTCYFALEGTTNTMELTVIEAANSCEDTLAPDVGRDESNIAGYLPVANITPLSCYNGTVAPTRPTTKFPTYRPSRQPTTEPTLRPSGRPTKQQTPKPTQAPTLRPSRQPSTEPTRRPSRSPTSRPTRKPTQESTLRPSRQPSTEPTRRPSRSPTLQPTRKPTQEPTLRPSRQPTTEPTRRPSRSPTLQQTRKPTQEPTSRPSRQPTTKPTRRPSRSPTLQPTRKPTQEPTSRPSRQPTIEPTLRPSRMPTSQPTRKPTRSPTHHPSRRPTTEPTLRPSRI